MKVTLEKDYRKFYTLEDLDHAKAVIAYEKENDDGKIEEWAEMAINEAGKYSGYGSNTCREILKATAHTARNCRVWDVYGDGTENMDVWIESVAETTFGFIKAGAYLSDIWQTGGAEYGHHMFIQIFEKK